MVLTCLATLLTRFKSYRPKCTIYGENDSSITQVIGHQLITAINFDHCYHHKCQSYIVSFIIYFHRCHLANAFRWTRAALHIITSVVSRQCHCWYRSPSFTLRIHTCSAYDVFQNSRVVHRKHLFGTSFLVSS